MTLDLELARARIAALRPRPERTDRYDLGDGIMCPEGHHGKTYMTDSGRCWCPVTQSIFDNRGTLVREGDHTGAQQEKLSGHEPED